MTADDRDYELQKPLKWVKAPSPPQKFLKIIRVNDNELIAVISSEFEYWKFNTIENKWYIWNKGSKYSNANNCCIDYENKMLWIINNYSIIKTNFNDNIMHQISTKISTSDIYPGIGASFVIVDSCLHIIGGSDNTKHYKLKNNQFSPECIYDFRANKHWKNGNYYHGLLHLKSQNQLLLFGGFELGPSGRTNKMFMHCLKSNKWRKLDVKLPEKLNSFGYIVTNDEKELIIFGGNTGDFITRDIVIISLETMSITQSKILCPKPATPKATPTYHAILLNERSVDEIFVYGYFRFYCNRAYDIIPLDIVNTLLRWSSTDYVHLISHNKHWKLPLNDIMEVVWCLFVSEL